MKLGKTPCTHHVPTSPPPTKRPPSNPTTTLDTNRKSACGLALLLILTPSLTTPSYHLYISSNNCLLANLFLNKPALIKAAP